MGNEDRDVAEKPRRKRATKRATAMRDMRIVRALAHGESIDEIALREGLTLRRARERVAAVVARRALEPTETFIAVQITRLNETMLVAYAAMKGGNMAAVDRVLKITREYDRYHGLALTLARRAGASGETDVDVLVPLALQAPSTDAPARIARAGGVDVDAAAPPASARCCGNLTLHCPTLKE